MQIYCGDEDVSPPAVVMLAERRACFEDTTFLLFWFWKSSWYSAQHSAVSCMRLIVQAEGIQKVS
jgi:hypothetical protein